MSFLWSLASFLVMISVLVAVHEFGHFWAARKCGIKVQRFSIGFGKVLWSRVDKKGTEFVLSLIPLGGYVKMLDERNEEVPAQLRSQTFNAKTVLQRAFVIAAGPVANFLFAILAYAMVYTVGMPSVKPVIDEVQPHSLAAQAGLTPNMQITAIDGSETLDWETINMVLATKMRQSAVEISVVFTDSNITQTKTLDLSNWTFDPENESALGALGIQLVRNKVEMTLSKVAENSPAQQADLQVGDKLFAADGSLLKWQDFVAQIQQGQPFDVRVERAGEQKLIALTPVLKDKNQWFIGVAPTVVPVAEQYRSELKYGILASLQKGVEKTAQLSWLTIQVVGKLLNGDLGLNNIGGPISIAKGAGISSEIGLIYYLSFMALISVNLGIMNLFPLPVLDGGHLLFLAAEGIRGKPLSDKVQNIAYRIGAAALLALTVFALFNDFLRL